MKPVDSSLELGNVQCYFLILLLLCNICDVNCDLCDTVGAWLATEAGIYC